MPASETTRADVAMHFPCAGLDLTRAYSDQRPRQIAPGVFARSTPVGQNVRGYEATTERRRGGVRPGLAKGWVQPVGGSDWIVQQLDVLVTAAEGTAVQQSQSGRIVRVVGVSQGNIYTAEAGALTWHSPTNQTGDTPPLIYTGQLFSAANIQKLWYADGTNWVYYDGQADSIYRWAATAGSLPVDSANNTPRLICTYRGRTVLSGLFLDPQNVFMSRVNDPTDFDYFSVAENDVTQAVALSVGPQGFTGDMVNSLCPYSDDILLLFCNGSIKVLSGDPAAGGQLDLLTSTVGGTWGICWAMGPDGVVYFMSNHGSVYAMTPGQRPQRISQSIDRRLQSVNTGDNVIRLAWNDNHQSLHVFITPNSAPAATTHYTWEARTGAWWSDVFANTNHNPVAMCNFDGNRRQDRVLMLGGWDGYVRFYDETATTDDGTAIASEVWLGPINTKNLDDVLFRDAQAVLGETSGDVTYSIMAGTTAEKALSSSTIRTGTWTAGRNFNTLIRRSAHALYAKVTAVGAWSMESIRVSLEDLGLIRRRGA